MKKFIKYITAACLGIISLNSCSDDDILQLNDSDLVAPKITSTATTANLSEATQLETAYTFEWTPADYGIPTSVNYQIEVTTAEGNFDNAQILSSTTSTVKYEAIGKDLNSFVVEKLGLQDQVESTIKYRITASLGTFNANKIYSEVKSITLTPFPTDLLTPWGVVGTITGWGSTPDIPFWKTTTTNVLEAYVTLAAGDLIKFRKDSDWAVNFGSSNVTLNPAGEDVGFKGTLVAGDSDISSPLAGNFKITLDLNASTFVATAFQWGIVGSGAANGWEGPDTQILTFDGVREVWYANAVTLNTGEIKFRKNNAWADNFGGANGTLVSGGDNIAVTAGIYNIVVDFKNSRYTITPAQ